MRAALRRRDRVGEISFGGWSSFFGKFFRAANYHFPALESLELDFPIDQELDIPATFLRGPDQSGLPLRRFRLYDATLASVTGLLLSAAALTDLTLTLKVNSNAAVFDPSQGSFLLDCLQGMQFLCSLDLTTSNNHPDHQSQHATSKDIQVVSLLKLTCFCYFGSPMFLNNFMSRLSAPSLQDVRFVLFSGFPLSYLSQVIDDVREEFLSVSITSNMDQFRLESWIHTKKIDHFKPSFRFNVILPLN